jgi:DNA-binding CsgD family transcriptional regulator
MLDLAVAVLNSTSGAAPWQLVVDELVRALHGTVCVLSEVHWESGYGRVHAWTPDVLGAMPLNSVLQGHIRSGHPLARRYATTGDRTPMAITDVIDTGSWRRSESYAITRQIFDSASHFAIPLMDPPGRARSFVVHHESMEFTSAERTYAARIQPLLAAMDAHFRLVARWLAKPPDGAPAPGEAAAAFGLTARETEVLALLAQACTAEAIGRRMSISTRTVHKHLESLYRKLRTSDRLATVLRAQHLGLLPQLPDSIRPITAPHA